MQNDSKQQRNFDALMKRNGELELEILRLRDQIDRLSSRLVNYESASDALRVFLNRGANGE